MTYIFLADPYIYFLGFCGILTIINLIITITIMLKCNGILENKMDLEFKLRKEIKKMERENENVRNKRSS